MTNDDLGTRMKTYEALTTSTMLMPNLPVYARLDGKAFHTFCRGLVKPFDPEFIDVMKQTCKDLVDKTNAKLGYVQSDEISLGWEDMTKPPFGGRLFKLESVFASMATCSFVLACMKYPKLKQRVEKYKPVFDCRVLQLPTMDELSNMFIWRENDATKNAISAVAQANFSHKQLQNKSSAEMQEMLFQSKGINFNDLDSTLKRGTYVKRVKVVKEIDEEVLKMIPTNKRPKDNKIIRSEIREFSLPIMKKITNKTGVYFYDEYPLLNGPAVQ